MKIIRLKRLLLVGFVFVALLLGFLLGYRLILGESLGIKRFLKEQIDQALVLANHNRIIANNKGDFTNVVFLHHSVGRNLIDEGGVREILHIHHVDFWDQDYSWRGLRDPLGKAAGFSYTIPGDNTDPDGLVDIFSQDVRSVPTNAISQLFQHETIILKSCFPTSNIPDDLVLNQRKSEYQTVREKMVQYPDHLFILVTQPPLTPELTTIDSAARARELADWLKSPEFIGDARNIMVFDLFDYLAIPPDVEQSPNTLKPEYQNGQDAHPNTLANKNIGPKFADFILRAIEDYRGINSTRPIANSN